MRIHTHEIRSKFIRLLLVVLLLIKPRHVRKGYSSRRVCVCLSVCYRASGYIPGLFIQSEVAYSFFCRLLKIHIVWISLKTFHSGDMALFACHMISDSALSWQRPSVYWLKSLVYPRHLNGTGVYLEPASIQTNTILTNNNYNLSPTLYHICVQIINTV